ncbi:MAG: sensor histidine kinase [Acidimicrobiia bacterium]
MREKALLIAVDRRTAAIAGASLIGFVLLGVLLSGLLGGARAAQLMVTLFVPSSIMIVFWYVARSRVLARESQFDAALELEAVTNRANSEFFATVSHELRLHVQLCSLRAEALTVAAEYGRIESDLKVAVPDVVLLTDPHLLRQVLHVLVGNALRRGGERVAIWATAEDDWVRLTVSDDGPGLTPEVGAHVFERYVDLAGNGRSSHSAGAGMSLVQTLGDLMGGQVTYKRDPSWTHFSLRLPMGTETGRPSRARVPLEAGVR